MWSSGRADQLGRPKMALAGKPTTALGMTEAGGYRVVPVGNFVREPPTPE
jgi:hypothetical protein